MPDLKISQLPEYTGNTSGSWLIMNNSGQTTTYKVNQQNFLSSYATTNSVTSLSSSIATTDLSQNNTIAGLATTSSLTSLSSSIAVTDLSQNNRLTAIESVTGSFAPSGNYATTGSNIFVGNQNITGSLTASGSVHTLTGQLLVNGTYNNIGATTGNYINSNVLGAGFNIIEARHGTNQISASINYFEGQTNIMRDNLILTGSLGITGSINQSVTGNSNFNNLTGIQNISGSVVIYGLSPTGVRALIFAPSGSASGSSISYSPNGQGTLSIGTTGAASNISIGANTTSGTTTNIIINSQSGGSNTINGSTKVSGSFTVTGSLNVSGSADLINGNMSRLIAKDVVIESSQANILGVLISAAGVGNVVDIQSNNGIIKMASPNVSITGSLNVTGSATITGSLRVTDIPSGSTSNQYVVYNTGSGQFERTTNSGGSGLKTKSFNITGAGWTYPGSGSLRYRTLNFATPFSSTNFAGSCAFKYNNAGGFRSDFAQYDIINSGSVNLIVSDIPLSSSIFSAIFVENGES